MATIYEASPGGLTAQPGRAVTTFPSGLIRVDQTYICTTTSAATHRATLIVGAAMPDGNSEPAMEALSIHPEPQEINRGDGFTEFRVSAYGRTKQTLSGIQLNQVLRNGTVNFVGSSIPIYAYTWEITGYIAIPFGQALTMDDFNFDPALSDPFNFSIDLQGELLEYSKVDDNTYSVETTLGVGTVAMGNSYFEFKAYQNFGDFVEVCVTISRGINSTDFV